MVDRSTTLILLFLAACEPTQEPPKGPEAMGDADRVLSLDMDGDGRDELFAVTNGRITWKDEDVFLGGDPQVQARGQIDGTEVVVLGTGRGRSSPDAPARIWRFDKNGAEKIWEDLESHHRFADLRIIDGRIYVAVFGPGKQVVGGWLENGELVELSRRAMAIQQIPLSATQLALGRLYGDAPRSHGDLLIVEEGKKDRVLPTIRGVRAMTSGDVDRDGHTDLVVSDGWHFRYGEYAQAQVVLYRGPDFVDRRVIGSFPGEYTVNQIEILDWPKKGPAWVVALGNRQAHLLKSGPAGWKDSGIQSIRETSRGVIFRDQEHRWLVVSGRPTVSIGLTSQEGQELGPL